MSCKMEGKKPREEDSEEVDAPAGAVLSRDAILQAQDIEVVAVNVPEWGGHVFVRVMTGRERDAFEASITAGGKEKTNMVDFRARFAVMVICDEEGERLFDAKDIDALTKKSAAALDRVFEVGKKINRIGEEEQQALVANFDQAPLGASGSA